MNMMCHYLSFFRCSSPLSQLAMLILIPNFQRFIDAENDHPSYINDKVDDNDEDVIDLALTPPPMIQMTKICNEGMLPVPICKVLVSNISQTRERFEVIPMKQMVNDAFYL